MAILRRDRNRTKLQRIGLAVVVIGAVSLVPWIVYLALTLPATYRADNWDLAWVGFDVLLLLLLAGTAVLGYLRHRLVSVTAFATGVLLLCDAWLDWTTSSGADHTWAIVTALAVELPLAAFLIISSVRSTAAGPTPRAIPVPSTSSSTSSTRWAVGRETRWLSSPERRQ